MSDSTDRTIWIDVKLGCCEDEERLYVLEEDLDRLRDIVKGAGYPQAVYDYGFDINHMFMMRMVKSLG